MLKKHYVLFLFRIEPAICTSVLGMGEKKGDVPGGHPLCPKFVCLSLFYLVSRSLERPLKST